MGEQYSAVIIAHPDIMRAIIALTCVVTAVVKMVIAVVSMKAASVLITGLAIIFTATPLRDRAGTGLCAFSNLPPRRVREPVSRRLPWPQKSVANEHESCPFHSLSSTASSIVARGV
jgi:hypothetical protein